MPNEPERVAGSDSLLPRDDWAWCTRDLVWEGSVGGEVKPGTRRVRVALLHPSDGGAAGPGSSNLCWVWLLADPLGPRIGPPIE